MRYAISVWRKPSGHCIYPRNRILVRIPKYRRPISNLGVCRHIIIGRGSSTYWMCMFGSDILKRVHGLTNMSLPMVIPPKHAIGDVIAKLKHYTASKLLRVCIAREGTIESAGWCGLRFILLRR
jgi:hypothetical protein